MFLSLDPIRRDGRRGALAGQCLFWDGSVPPDEEVNMGVVTIKTTLQRYMRVSCFDFTSEAD